MRENDTTNPSPVAKARVTECAEQKAGTGRAGRSDSKCKMLTCSRGCR